MNNSRAEILAELADASTTADAERVLAAFRWSLVPDDPDVVQVNAAIASACWDIGDGEEGIDENGDRFISPGVVRFVIAPMYRALVAAAKGIGR